jgi:hypothetical protein
MNVAEAVEHVSVLMKRALHSTQSAPEFYDVEIAVFQAAVTSTLPLLGLIFHTPDWRQRSHHRLSGGVHSGVYACLLKGFLRFAFWQYFLWGVHMSCYPKHPEKAMDGGWLFVLARGSAATFYLDLPLLFVSIWHGVMMLVGHWFGIGVPNYEDAVGHLDFHVQVGTRFGMMVMVHSLSHLVWLARDGPAYLTRLWDGSTLNAELPFVTGIVMSISTMLVFPAYKYLKERRYRLFRLYKRIASLLAVPMALAHGAEGALGNPTLFAFVITTCCFGLLDRYIMRRCRETHAAHLECLETRGNNHGSRVLILKLDHEVENTNITNQPLGHIYLSVPTISGMQPFTLIVRRNGQRELHISLNPRIASDKYANWSMEVVRYIDSLRYCNKNMMPVTISGPFQGGNLANLDLLREQRAVVLVAFGTGFAGCQQVLARLCQNGDIGAGVHVSLLCKSNVDGYFETIVRPICQEFGVRDIYLTPEEPAPNREQFWLQVRMTVEMLSAQYGVDHVLVEACGPGSAMRKLHDMFDSTGPRVECEGYGH